MRHFLLPPRPIPGLSCRVTLPTAARPLVSLPRFTHALPAAYRSAPAPAKLLALITVPTQLHLFAAQTALK